MAQLVYNPSPTGIRFHNDDSRVRAVMGPVGSGKSSMCITELLRRAMLQAPDEQNRRRSKALVVRNTFGELKSTTIKSCEVWWAGLGKFIYDSPIRFICERSLPDGTVLDFEAIFLPLDRPDQVGKLRSLEVTFAWINEAVLVPASALQVINGRIGRYPKVERDPVTGAKTYGPTWRGIILDTNPCSEKHWFHDLFVKRKGVDEYEKIAEKYAKEIDEDVQPVGFAFYEQPGGLRKVEDYEGNVSYEPDPDAENIENLDGGFGYYLNQLAGAEEDYISTMLCGQFGTTFSGKPVYPSFKAAEHVVDERLVPVRGLPIVVGMDFGLNPAAVFTQMDHLGSLLVFDELCAFDILVDEFLDDMLLPRIAARYAGFQLRVVGDPSGRNRSSLSMKTVYDKLSDKGLASSPAVTNDFLMRRDAVATYLNRRGGMRIAKSCEYIVDGFKGGYHYAAYKGSATSFKKEPEKNDYSHVHDGLQYAGLYYQRGLTQPGRIRVRRARVASGPSRSVHYA